MCWWESNLFQLPESTKDLRQRAAPTTSFYHSLIWKGISSKFLSINKATPWHDWWVEHYSTHTESYTLCQVRLRSRSINKETRIKTGNSSIYYTNQNQNHLISEAVNKALRRDVSVSTVKKSNAGHSNKKSSTCAPDILVDFQRRYPCDFGWGKSLLNCHISMP